MESLGVFNERFFPAIQLIPIVASIEYKKTDDTHQFSGRSLGMRIQVVVGSRSVEPEFVMMILPHRSGDKLPSTAWNEDKSGLTISWKDQPDVFQVSTTPEGRRVFEKAP